jgi:signal transduction histidine kinase
MTDSPPVSGSPLMTVAAIDSPVESSMRHPLRLLLYIEWIFFAGVMVWEVAPHRLDASSQPVWLNIGILVLLAVMGLRLPTTSRLLFKFAYIIAQVILISVVILIGKNPFFGLLYIVVMFRSYLIFGRQYRLWILASIFALSIITINSLPPRHSFRENRISHQAHSHLPNRPFPPGGRRDDGSFKWGFVFMFGGILLSLQLLVDRIVAEKQAKEELAIANQRIRSYALKAQEMGSLQERNRIAREIHDSLGHSLTALNLHLEMALKLSQVKPEKSREVLAEAKRLGSIALNDVRQSVSAMRSDPLQNQDLPTAIQKLAAEFEFSNNLKPLCHLDAMPQIPQSITTTIYRIVQEALTNISKYAQASEVRIEIYRRPTELELRIIDNGQGFIPTNNVTGFGLQGMRERVLSLQGRFAIISEPQQGCQIVAIIPVTGDQILEFGE